MLEFPVREFWRISSSGFWRVGDVNKTEDMIDLYCTWKEAVKIMNRWRYLEADHAARQRELDDAHRRRVELFKSNPGAFL